MKFKTFLLSLFEFIINPFSVIFNIDVKNNNTKSTYNKHKVLKVFIWVLLSIAISGAIVYLSHLYAKGVK